MIRAGIVADDLTGAVDAAVPFARVGCRTELRLRDGTSTATVVAVTTDSRARTAPDAAGTVAAAVSGLREQGIALLYKKIDSTLRGQIRAEVRAAMEAWSPDAIAVVCPAFPAMGRTVVGGQMLVDGVPVSETAAGSDPVTPVSESHVPTLVGGSHVGHVFGESVRALADRIVAGGPISVVDASSQSDIQRLAEALDLLGPQIIPVGSAGLALPLASLWRLEKGSAPCPPSEPPVVNSGIVIVMVTSAQHVARRQAATVAGAGARHHEPAVADLIDDNAWAQWSARVIDELEDPSPDLLLTAPTDRGPGLSATLIPKRFAELAARAVAGASRRAHGRVAGLVVTGGDGARALVDALETTAIEICNEVAAGVPIGKLVGGPAHGLLVVTKAGGFGNAETLLDAVRVVRSGRYA